MKINVKKIFNDHRLDVETSARKLFPRNNYPAKALSRVFKNQSLLNSKQLVVLSELTGLTVDQLYAPDKGAVLLNEIKVVLPNNVRAMVDTDVGVTRIYKDSKEPLEIWHGNDIKIGDYFTKLINKIIN